MREYVQGQRIRVKTDVETSIPLRQLVYEHVHEDAPGERITISHQIASPPKNGTIEVILNGEIPSGQATGVYRLQSVKAYCPDAAEPGEAITDELCGRAEFHVGLRSDYPARERRAIRP